MEGSSASDESDVSDAESLTVEEMQNDAEADDPLDAEAGAPDEVAELVELFPNIVVADIRPGDFQPPVHISVSAAQFFHHSHQQRATT